LWAPGTAAMPEAIRTSVTAPADLGPGLDSSNWLMVPTKYHQLYYQASADLKTVAEAYRLLDNVYEFLSRRSPAKPDAPVRVFLVPGERGKSRSSKQMVAARTGADADATFIISSLIHEETHLFNFAFLGNAAQGWWAGEYTCIYHQERARLTRAGGDLKTAIARPVPKSPLALSSLEGGDQSTFDAAVSALYFLEETYGATRMIEFRRASLLASKNSNGRPLPISVFRSVFGKDASALDVEWRKFFGWGAI